jgi:hypothetical protein
VGTGWDFCEAASSLPEPKEKSDEILLADLPSVDTIVMLDPEEQLYLCVGGSLSLNQFLQLSSCTMLIIRLKIERTWESCRVC